MSGNFQSKLKPGLISGVIKDVDGIAIFQNTIFMGGDNGKYMKMYDRISYGLESNIPGDVTEKKTEFLWNNRFYCITFRKI